MTNGKHEEVDYEVDAHDLPDAVVPGEIGAPSVVVEDLHISYRVFGAGGKPIQEKRSLLQRILAKGRRNIGNVREIHAVRGVSFVAHHGESIGIIGTNGSGKSTLLKSVAGLLPIESGNVYCSGIPSLLGVNAVLMSQLSGERNIRIGCLALGLTPEEVDERFDEIVDFAGIGDFVYLPMKSYSSGMAARLRFAISTASIPDVLMIDEALATGDASFRKKSAAKIAEIRDQAGTVFLVSHSLATIRTMCTRAIWMDKGLIKMDGPVGEVCDAYHEATNTG